MTSIFLQSTQAIGDFLMGAVPDTLDATVAGISAMPGQVVDASKYAFGVDRVVGENRSWSKLGTGYRGNFWDGDNGPNRLVDRVSNALWSFTLGGINIIGGGAPYALVNEKMGIDCPYFFPGPTNAREIGRFFSSGVIMMLTGRQILTAFKPRVVLPTNVTPRIFKKRPPIAAQGPIRMQYSVPSVAQDLATHIRRGSVVAPSILRRMLDVRTPEVVGPAARTMIELVREGHLPTHLLEGILWDTHPRTAYLFQYLSDMRVGSPRLRAIWNHLQLDAYEVEVFANGDTQLRLMYTPVQEVPSCRITAPVVAPIFF